MTTWPSVNLTRSRNPIKQVSRVPNPVTRRRGGKKKRETDRWERWGVLTAAARLAVLIYELMRDHVIGSGPGPWHLR